MQISINLTVVLVTIIVCLFLYAICKTARKDEKKENDIGTRDIKKVNDDTADE